MYWEMHVHSFKQFVNELVEGTRPDFITERIYPAHSSIFDESNGFHWNTHPTSVVTGMTRTSRTKLVFLYHAQSCKNFAECFLVIIRFTHMQTNISWRQKKLYYNLLVLMVAHVAAPQCLRLQCEFPFERDVFVFCFSLTLSFALVVWFLICSHVSHLCLSIIPFSL